MTKWMKESWIRLPWSSIAPQRKATKMYWAQWDSLQFKDGVADRLWATPPEDYTATQLLLPKKLRALVLQHLQDSEPFRLLEISKTMKRVHERFYWVGCNQYVKQWCSSHETYARREGPPKSVRAPVVQYNIGAPNKWDAVDMLGPLPKSESGKNDLIIVADYFLRSGQKPLLR